MAPFLSILMSYVIRIVKCHENRLVHNIKISTATRLLKFYEVFINASSSNYERYVKLSAESSS